MSTTRNIIEGIKNVTSEGVTKAQVGLGSVDNTTDANKPVSTATQTALNGKAPIASPVFTGNLTAPSADINGGTIDGTTIGGTTSAAGSFTRLSVSGGYPQVLLNNDSVGSGVEVQFYDGGVLKQIMGHISSTEQLQFRASNDGSPHLVLNSSGNVGIGTTNPTAKLDVNGTAKFNGIVTVNAGNLLVGTSTDNGVDRLQVNGSISFFSRGLGSLWGGWVEFLTDGKYAIYGNTSQGMPTGIDYHWTIDITTYNNSGTTGKSIIAIRIDNGDMYVKSKLQSTWTDWIMK